MESAPQTPANYKGVTLAAWVLIALTCLVALIPGVGFITWLVGAPILLVTFILGIVALSKGGTLQGILILLASVIAAPLFLFIAPIITTGGALAAGASSIEDIENSNEESERSLSTTEELSEDTPKE